MKLKNKALWVFAGGILLVLLLFLEQQFFQTRKKTDRRDFVGRCSVRFLCVSGGHL